MLTLKSVGLGTIKTYGSYGVGLSFHQRAINELAIRPGMLSNDILLTGDPRSKGWFFGVGVVAEAVAWNILLDGTAFQDSPSVDKKNFVGHLIGNAGYKWGRFALHYSLVITSETFEDQQDVPDNFGSIQFGWLLD